ncbi:MAG: sugar ABC transporter permease YjfF [Anaerolineales bacterium]|nr:sugar ABC transporter permease YjfF [Anaerolineales bacterium]
MMQKIGAFISNNRKNIPLAATIVLFFAAYGFGAFLYPGMRDAQVFFNLFRSNSFLLISAIGMTFVILTGGIDLSVSGVVALTTVAAAALLREGWNAWLVMLVMLLMGMALGAIMGCFITYLKVQPFIATLAGMWFARGMCFFISDDAIVIKNRIYSILGGTRILIPGLSDPVAQTGAFISILVVIEFIALAAAMYIAHFTRFGRTVYAIGGNEQSARLMGLPVNRTKVLVYTISGFCSALSGICLSIYVSSGHGLYAQMFELDVIASVVMGGTMLTGGVGSMFGTLFGVLILAVTQTLIQFNGQLSSWWTRIVIGALTLIFIGVQSQLAGRKGRRQAKQAEAPAALFKRRRAFALGGAALLVILAALTLSFFPGASGSEPGAETPTSKVFDCALKPFRDEEAANLMQAGAVITYERNGGPRCIDELYAIYPDGRIVGNDGVNEIEKQITLEELDKLLAGISARGWFTDEMYDTWHTPCGQCFEYHITISYQGQVKLVKAVDGGTDAPANYWQVVSLINGSIPKFESQ